jgi:hypothetical protein
MSKCAGRLVGLSLVFCCVLSACQATVFADTLQSPHYRLEESDLGGGGVNISSSPNYRSVLSVSDTAVGNSSSANFQTNAGSQTTPDPSLSFVINNGAASFGSFSATQTATATTSFSISNYTSYGYIVQISGTTPKNGSHTIPAMGATASGPDNSVPGMEQFGINLVANTSPKSFGANPDQGQFGFGTYTPNYGTTNKYRFVNGETIASAPKSSGVTTYTISYIVNVASLTPGGQYTSNQQIIVVGTY